MENQASQIITNMFIQSNKPHIDISIDTVSMLKHEKVVNLNAWTSAWTKCPCSKTRKQYVTKQFRIKISH